MLVRVVGVLDNLILQTILDMSPCDSELRDPVDDVNRQIETINLVLNGEFEGRIDIPFFHVAADVEVLVIGPAVGELVNQPGVTVEEPSTKWGLYP